MTYSEKLLNIFHLTLNQLSKLDLITGEAAAETSKDVG